MVREAKKGGMEKDRKKEESRMKECLERGARKKSLRSKGAEQMFDCSIEGGIISFVVQEESRQHSEMKSVVGDNKLVGGFGPGQRVGEEGLSDSILIIKEHSQADDEKLILQVEQSVA